MASLFTQRPCRSDNNAREARPPSVLSNNDLPTTHLSTRQRNAIGAFNTLQAQREEQRRTLGTQESSVITATQTPPLHQQPHRGGTSSGTEHHALVTVDEFVDSDNQPAGNSSDDEAEFFPEQCCICLAEEATHSLQPCGHRNFCRDCATLILAGAVTAHSEPQCPICGTEVHDSLEGPPVARTWGSRRTTTAARQPW